MNQTILRVLVGSHAHGLAEPTSDKDFRSVFVIPTVELFRLGFKYQETKMTKGDTDETSWEIGAFLIRAVQCHPLALETMVAPVEVEDEWGRGVRSLFPCVWSAQTVYDSFLAYGNNQRRKMLEKMDGRPEKYAVAYLRTLFNLCELLERETFGMRIAESPIGDTLRRIKSGMFRPGEVIDLGEFWREEASRRLVCCAHTADPHTVEEFLINLRRGFLQ